MKAQSFRKDQRGTIAIMFAFLLPVMIAASALGIEALRVMREKARLQNALDAAALAAGEARFAGASDDSVRAIAENMLRANLVGSELKLAAPAVTIRIGNGAEAANRVTLDAIANMNGIGMGVSNGTIPVGAHSAAETSNQKVEVALVLDTTLSMSFDGKMDQLKTSAKDFATKLMMMPDGRSPRPNVSVAVVPFNDYVWLSQKEYKDKYLSWLSGNRDVRYNWKEEIAPTSKRVCSGGYVRKDAEGCYLRSCTRMLDGKEVPDQCWGCDTPESLTCPGGFVDELVPGRTVDASDGWHWYGAIGSRSSGLDEQIDGLTVDGSGYVGALEVSPNARTRLDGEAPATLQRLTPDKTKIDYVIDNLVPARETYTAPGVLWGWHTLDPGPPFGDGKVYGDTLKVIILMTDGVNTLTASPTRAIGKGGNAPSPFSDPAVVTSPLFYHSAANTDGKANDKTLKICTAVKAKGIRVYSIAYMFENNNMVPAAKQMLQSCATDNARFYDATSTQLLDRAFKDIVAELIPLRLAE